jgi:predicted peptidase
MVRTRRVAVLGVMAVGLAMLVGCQSGGQESGMRLQAGTQQASALEREIVKTVKLKYLIYLPDDYGKERGKQWPLMLFLHGAGERGEDLEKVKYNGPPKLIAAGRDYPCIVVSPLCPEGQWWDTEALFVLLDDLCEKYPIDEDRVYLTGLSMGGFATWQMACAQPRRFAAAVPICGGGNVHEAGRVKDLPLWAFHGAQDNVVPVERTDEMIDAIRKAGGRPAVTIYPDEGHGSWVPAYQDEELYRWLFAQRRR